MARLSAGTTIAGYIAYHTGNTESMAPSWGGAHYADNKYAYFGTGDDMKMYFSGSYGYVDVVGSSSRFYLRVNGTETAFLAYANGGSYMYANDVARINASTSGAAITGALTATGNITAYSSDARLKTNVRELEGGLATVLSLRGVTFDWDKEKCDFAGFNPGFDGDVGFIAQELEGKIINGTAQAPFTISSEEVPYEGEEYLTIHSDRIIPYLVAAIKELNQKIEELS